MIFFHQYDLNLIMSVLKGFLKAYYKLEAGLSAYGYISEHKLSCALR